MQPRTFYASDHEINPSHIDKEALYTLSKLKQAGFLAYLVGGSVRDLLKGLRPKDYDISTNALPEEIKKIFRGRCLLIGRRFRLAHVRFSHKIFEVSTFRSGQDSHELIVRDNEWGTPEEDALRRDFTVNGLFYDPETHHIIDYVGGWDDIHKNVLRTIGQPEKRFAQDPVRMMRLLKFQARFNFAVCEETKKALLSCHKEIIKCSPARVLEELLRMLESGAAKPFFALLYKHGFLQVFMPELDKHIKKEGLNKTLHLIEVADDLKNHDQKMYHRSVLVAALLFPILEKQILDKEDIHPISISDILFETEHLLNKLAHSSFSKLPKNLSFQIEYLLSTQFRLTPLNPKHRIKLKQMLHKNFNEAMQLFELRALNDARLIDLFGKTQHRMRQAKNN